MRLDVQKYVVPFFAMIGVTVVMFGVGSAIAGCHARDSYAPTPLTPAESGYSRPPLAGFADECYGAASASSMLGPGLDNIEVSTSGKDKQEMLNLECLLNRLKAPSDMTWRLGQTRALDGQQEVSWQGYAARWTYSPGAGLDLLITAKGAGA